MIKDESETSTIADRFENFLTLLGTAGVTIGTAGTGILGMGSIFTFFFGVIWWVWDMVGDKFSSKQ